jgi:hypothetical protein
MSLNIKKETLVGLLENYKGHTFCHLDTVTSPKLLKKGRETGLSVQEKFGVNPDMIKKHSSFGCGIGFEYAETVKNRLVKDGKNPTDYQAGESWHISHNGSTVIREHKNTGELYFYASLIANNRPVSEYKAENVVINKDDLKEYLPVESAPKNQGLDEGREIEVRTLKLSSVKRLVAENSEYIVE